MNIAFVSSEVVPFTKSGGLADVAGALPKAVAKLGHNVKVFTPKYNLFDEQDYRLESNWKIGEMPIRIAGRVRAVHLHQGKLPDSKVEVNFIDCPYYFHRGKIYTNDPDEDERFILFAKAVIETIQRLNWTPDVIHCNDWQSGLIPLYIKDNYSWDKLFNRTATLFTIHNIGYQGRFSADTRFKAEISGKYFYPTGPVEFYGDINFLKAGIMLSDIINTVSETYAKEILTSEYGSGMEGALNTRKDDLYGIVNGVDYETWSPENDSLIPFRYSKKYLTGKKKNKKLLMEHLNLSYNEDVPLIGIVSRFAIQKGFDIIAEVINSLMDLNASWVILGSGESRYEELFRNLSEKYPDKVSVYVGFNNELAHLIEAGSDMFLMPSHYEPCGLNQIYSLKYGTVPIVRKTGGLADTVVDWFEELNKGNETGTGFSFSKYNGTALKETIEKAVKTYENREVWKKIQLNGMRKDYSWKSSASQYVELYEKAVNKRRSYV